jgi:hypothetical protein
MAVGRSRTSSMAAVADGKNSGAVDPTKPQIGQCRDHAKVYAERTTIYPARSPGGDILTKYNRRHRKNIFDARFNRARGGCGAPVFKEGQP